MRIGSLVELLVWKAQQASEQMDSYQQKEKLNSDTLRELRYGNILSAKQKYWVCVGNWYVKLSPPDIERLLMQNQTEIHNLKKRSKEALDEAKTGLDTFELENS